MPSPEKFRETLDDFKVGQDVIDEMYAGFGNLESKTNKKRLCSQDGKDHMVSYFPEMMIEVYYREYETETQTLRSRSCI